MVGCGIGAATYKNYSVVDYCIMSPELFSNASNFEILTFDPLLSDVHNGIAVEFISKPLQQNIYILSVVALDETNIFGCLHFSMQNVEMLCDLDRASRQSNVNVSQYCPLFIDFCVTSFMYRHGVMSTIFAP